VKQESKKPDETGKQYPALTLVKTPEDENTSRKRKVS
jgi:hypothetical protein